jgi:hypothetical protein
MPAGNKWYFNGNLIPNATGQTYQPTVSGDYTATYTDEATGCESESSNILTWLITGSSMTPPGNVFEVFPNPAKDELTVRFDRSGTGPVSLSIVNTLGQEIDIPCTMTGQGTGIQKAIMNTTSLPAGVYFCILKTAGNHFVKNIVIVK